MQKVTQNGKTVVFYQKDGDEKFSFLIEGEPVLTDRLLSSVSNKRVKEKDIPFAVKGIFDRIENGLHPAIQTLDGRNPMAELAETVQKIWGESLHSRVTGQRWKRGKKVISVEVRLPTGAMFTAHGPNQKEARKQAAQDALRVIALSSEQIKQSYKDSNIAGND